MCGIAGIIDFYETTDYRPLLQKMVAKLHHRGPDATGYYQNGPATLGHARLSIIDLAGGDQPIHNEDKSVWVVFNGEIFNYLELRKELIQTGHQFYTESDTEVIVHLYEEKGTDLFKYLNGQFAIAIWDQRRGRLILGRDRLGIRPLYYCHSAQGLVFASEIKAIFANRTILRQLDLQTLSDVFTCWAPLGDATAFAGVKQLLPGHYAVIDKGGMATRQYWQLRYDHDEQDFQSIEQWAEELNALIKDATRLQLRADVPVGAYLSGGLDSTYLSGLVKYNFNNQLKTYSVGFQQDQFDESKSQQLAVAALETEHRSIQCSNDDIGEIFPKVIWHTETALLRTAPAPLFMLSRLVREDGFKVVLTGEGADELFAGYNIFKEDRVRRFWARYPESRMRPALFARLYPFIFNEGNARSRQFTLNFFKQGLDLVDSPAYSHLVRWKNTSYIKTFLQQDVLDKTSNLDQFVERFSDLLPSGYMKWQSLSRAQYTESSIFLANYLLSSQGDRMTMGNSIEGRYPFLDHRVVEFSTRIPVRFRMQGLCEKAVLKAAAKTLVPDSLISRPKHPYRAPISQAFFGEKRPGYVDELLSQSSITNSGYFDPKKVATLVNKCKAQNGSLASERENMALVGILSTQLLHYQFVQSFADY